MKARQRYYKLKKTINQHFYEYRLKKKKQNLFLALRIDQQKGRKPRNKSLWIYGQMTVKR